MAPPGRSYASITKTAGVTVSCVDAATQTDPVLITAAPQSSSYNAASTETSTTSQRDTSETLVKPKKNNTARTPDPKQRGKGKAITNTDRQPKGSDDPIWQHNRFSTLEDMEAEESLSCIPKGTLNRFPSS